MKKTLRRVAVVVSMATIMTASFAGCAKKTTCASCEQEKKCNKYEISFEGEKSTNWICDDCIDTYKSLTQLVGGTIKKK